jgi:Flp pilus assembly protein TadB
MFTVWHWSALVVFVAYLVWRTSKNLRTDARMERLDKYYTSRRSK